MNAALLEIRAEVRERLQRVIGPRLDRLILFGSHARGDADPDSDIDILVVLSSESAIRESREPLSEAVADLSLKYDADISCLAATAQAIEHSGMPFYRNVRREGVPL